MMTDDDFFHTILKNNYHNFNDLWSGHLFQQNDIYDFLPDFPHLFEASLMLKKDTGFWSSLRRVTYLYEIKI